MGEGRGTRDLPRGLKKDWRKLAIRMRDVGWTFEQGGRHPKCFAPDGHTWTTLPGTPGDVAAWRNARAVFRRWCRENEVEPGI
jgi:hypothetical protein